jgi:hypothetical protein
MTQEQQNALKSLMKGLPLDRAKQWLLSTQIEDERGCGWPHLTAQDRPQVWGGTLDGIRGLASAGVSRHEPQIQKALDWLFTQQDIDGGFGSREMTYPAIEPTAWVLITLKDIGYELKNDARVQKAVSFLEECVNDDGLVGTSSIDDPRTYPTILTLWALHDLSGVTTRIARSLKDSRSAKTGGWGIRVGTTSNILSTTQVLFVLLKTGHLDKDDVITRQSVEYILSGQQENGRWSNFSETWYSQHQPNIPLRCDEYVTPWAIKALLSAGVTPMSKPLSQALSWLVHEQSSDGYWLFDTLDESKHIWCVVRSMRALALARERLIASMTEGNLTLSELAGESRETISTTSINSRITKVVDFIRSNVTNIIVIILALYVFRFDLRRLINQLLNFLSVQSDSVLSNLVASAIWLILVFLGTLLLNRLRSRNE